MKLIFIFKLKIWLFDPRLRRSLILFVQLLFDATDFFLRFFIWIPESMIDQVD